MMQIQVTEEKQNSRIDKFLSEETEYSRSKISSLIDSGNILVNGNITKNNYLVKEGDIITLNYVEKELTVEPENLNLDIVYEDEDVIVVNKPNGMVVHPAVGNPNHTLVNGLMYHSKNLSNINGEFRPGIVHRIDADTTGLLMVAKNNKAHEILARELEEKKTHRIYYALVWGVINNDTGTIDAPIGRSKMIVKKWT